MEILRSQVTAEVIQLRQGWFEVRLVNGRSGWIWGTFVDLLLGGIGADEERGLDADRSQDIPTGKVFLLDSGYLRAVDVLEQSHDGAKIVTVGDRSVICDSTLLRNASRLPNVSDQPERKRVALSDGTVLEVRSIEYSGNGARLVLPSGESIALDPSRLAS